jgi:uncharacterized protein
MRLSSEIIDFLKLSAAKQPQKVDVYLFGSRTDDHLRGGDIDILILSEISLSRSFLRSIKTGFFKQFGLQKLDLINFTFSEKHPFKSMILENAVLL